MFACSSDGTGRITLRLVSDTISSRVTKNVSPFFSVGQSTVETNLLDFGGTAIGSPRQQLRSPSYCYHQRQHVRISRIACAPLGLSRALAELHTLWHLQWGVLLSSCRRQLLKDLSMTGSLPVLKVSV